MINAKSFISIKSRTDGDSLALPGILCFFVILSLLTPSMSFGSEVSDKLEQITNRLIQQCDTQYTKEKKPVIAVMPFDNATSKLSEKRVGFAVSELLNHWLLKSGRFSVTERIALQKVLEEQALGLSGAISTESAVRVGKLIGAELLAMGSVNEVGSNYQITVRIVHAETGEAIATDFKEIQKQYFDEEAKSYLVLVPEEQAIGIYISAASFTNPGISRFSKNTIQGAFDTANYSLQYEPYDFIPNTLAYDIGLRYFLHNWLMLDIGWSFNFLGFEKSKESLTATIQGDTTVPNNKILYLARSSSGINLGLNAVLPITKSVRCFFGAGGMINFTNYKLSTDNENFTSSNFNLANWEKHSAGDYSVYDSVTTDFIWSSSAGNKSSLCPFARFVAEWFPQSRLGINFITSVYYINDPGVDASIVISGSKNGGTSTAISSTPIKLFQMSGYVVNFGGAVIFYF